MRIEKHNNSKKNNFNKFIKIISEFFITIILIFITIIFINNQMKKLENHQFSSMKIKNYTVKPSQTPTPRSQKIISKNPVKHEKLMPTDLDIKRYTAAWNMYLAHIFQGSDEDGYYTDSNLMTPVKDFWSNGIYAEFDSDEDGNHEMIFKVKDKNLVYIGILGRYNIFTVTSDNYRKLTGRSFDEFIALCTPQKIDQEVAKVESIKDGKGNSVYKWTDADGNLHSVAIEDGEPKK